MCRALIALLFTASICLAQTTDPQPAPTSSALLKTAWAQFEVNDLDSALATVNRVIALEPKSGSAALLRFLIFNRKDPNGDHSAEASKVIDLAPSKEWVEQAYIYRASIRLQQSDHSRAIEDCSSAVVLNPSSTLAYELRSYAYLMKSDYANSRADYERSLELNPQTPSPFVVRAFWRLRNDLFEQALADYQSAIEWKPNYAEAHVDRGIVLGLMGRIDAAFESLKKGRDLAPQAIFEKEYHGVGSSPFWDLNSFVVTHPKNARGYEMRGILRLFQQKKAEADQDFTKSIELDSSLRPEIEKAARVFN